MIREYETRFKKLETIHKVASIVNLIWALSAIILFIVAGFSYLAEGTGLSVLFASISLFIAIVQLEVYRLGYIEVPLDV